MSVTSIALSIIAFGVSKYFGSGDFSDAIYSELGVGSLGDVFKSSSEKALSTIFKNPPPEFRQDELNHHLNKAARMSVLLATFYACRGTLIEIAEEGGKGEEKKWLGKLSESLQKKLLMPIMRHRLHLLTKKKLRLYSMPLQTRQLLRNNLP